VRVARAGEVTGQAPLAASAEGRDLVLLRTPGGLRAYDGRCPHQGALLAEGELEGRTLVCRNHRWKFDVETGAGVGVSACLRACPVREQGEDVLVDVTALARPPGVAAAPALRAIADLPGPEGLPLLGNALALRAGRTHLVLEEWARRYGTMFVVRIGRRPLVVLSDPRLYGPVLRERPETYRRPSNLEAIFDEMMVSGVFSAEGEAWRAQRRLAMQALSQRHLRGFYPTLREVALRLRRRWLAAAQDGRELDVAEELKRFTVDVTTRLVFGHDANTIERSDDDLVQRHLAHIFPAFNRRLFAPFPYWRYLRLAADRRLDRALREVYAWLEEVIGRAREALAAHPERAESPANFIEAMLTARDEQGRPFPDSVLFGNALTMLLAGEDTTAYTLAWSVHHLCDSPSAVAALRAEVDAALGDELAPVDLDQASLLPYATAVANEAMRLRPVANVLLFEANRDVVIGDVAIPRHTRLGVLTRIPVLDPARFESPERFSPERWLEGAANGRAHDPSSVIPFGSGPRICPGRALALLEMRVVLATLYRSFEIERVGDSADVRELAAFTIAPVGLRARVRARTGRIQ
jgi:cytochrome P450/nitrite reductase/ring-hydroxylating ferredoxin subunit